MNSTWSLDASQSTAGPLVARADLDAIAAEIRADIPPPITEETEMRVALLASQTVTADLMAANSARTDTLEVGGIEQVHDWPIFLIGQISTRHGISTNILSVIDLGPGEFRLYSPTSGLAIVLSVSGEGATFTLTTPSLFTSCEILIRNIGSYSYTLYGAGIESQTIPAQSLVVLKWMHDRYFLQSVLI